MRKHPFAAVTVAYFCFLLLAGCAALGVATPQTFNERLAAGYTSVTGVRSLSNTLLQDHKITADDHLNVERQADTARAGLDIASTLQPVDQSGADAKLQSALQIVTALDAYLRSKR